MNGQTFSVSAVREWVTGLHRAAGLTKRMRSQIQAGKRVGVLLLLLCAANGCGDGGSHPRPASQTLSGMVFLPEAMSAEGLTVRSRAPGGGRIDSTRTSPTGWFQLQGEDGGRLEARLPDGTLLAAEVGAVSRRVVNISIPTTIISRYAQSNPQLSLTEIDARVHESLAVPARIDLRRDLGDSWRSFFSATAFRQAAGHTALNTFIDQAVTRAETGATEAFRLPNPYPTLFRSLHPQEADYYGIAQQPPAEAGALAPAADSNNDSTFASALANLGKNALSAGATAGAGWACQQLGIGSSSSTAAEYAEIISELNMLQNDIEKLAVSTELESEINAANVYANNLQSQFSLFNSYLQQNDSAGAVSAAQLLNAYVNPANGAKVVTDINGVTDYLLGTAGGISPLAPLYAALIENSTFGVTSPSGANFFLDVRSNDALCTVATLVDYYLGAAQVGAIMQAEFAHLDPNTFNTVFISNVNANTFASNIQEALDGQDSVNVVAANLTSAMQLNPPDTIAGGADNVTSSAGNAMYQENPHPVLMYMPIQGPTVLQDAEANAAAFGVGPIGPGEWFIAGYYDLVTLREYASNLGNGDVNRGLYDLKIIANYTKDDILLFDDPPYSNLYNITKGNASVADISQPYNYLLVHYAPAPSEDPGTVRAIAYPISTSISGATGTAPYFEALTSTGTYVDANPTEFTDVDVTPAVTWSSSDPSQATVANYAAVTGIDGSGNGVVTFQLANAAATATATLCTSLVGSPDKLGSIGCGSAVKSTFPVGGPAQPPVLTSILVSPFLQNYATLSGGGTLAVNCYATGFYSNNTVQDLTDKVTWSLTSTKGIAAFNTAVPNQLDLFQAEGDDSITIMATYDGVQGNGTVTTSFP